MFPVVIFKLFVIVAALLSLSSWRIQHSRRVRIRELQMKTEAKKDDQILRRIDKWACMKNCGACCKLGPLESRPDLPEYLSADELVLYKSMIGKDDWCIHFDKTSRMCTQYDIRPGFCRVDLTNYVKIHDIKAEEFTDFCSFCCTENIADVYGKDSEEMDRYEDVLAELDTSD